MRRVFALFGLFATLLVAWMTLVPSRAVATVEGPCTAFIDGVDVTAGRDSPDTAVPLQSGTQVRVVGTAQGRVTDLSYTVHVAGAGVRVGNVTIAEDGLSWAGTVNLEEFSGATVGLFEVTSEVETESDDCSGVAYVCIEGRSPFTTAAGAGATAVGVGGGILLALSLVGGGGLAAGRAAVQGFAGGATAGLGGAVLLQQFCTLPLTTASAVGIPLAVGAAGAVGSSLLRRSGTRGARRVAAHPSAEPTQAIERSSELRHAADAGAEGRELAGAGQSSGGGSASGAGGGGPSSGPPGGGAPGGAGLSAPAGGGPSGGPAPGGAGGASPAGGPAPSGPGGGAAPGGPAPSGPGGGAAPDFPEVPTGPPAPDGGIVIPPVPPPIPDEGNGCPTCGAENTPDSQFCTSCGTRLGT